MTEAEWQSTDDWNEMLEWLLGLPISDRKWILYACGGLRQIWDRGLDSAHSRNPVEVAERAADGLATEEEIQHAAYLVHNKIFGYDLMGEFVLVKLPGERFSPDFCRLTDWGNIQEEVELGTGYDSEQNDNQPLDHHHDVDPNHGDRIRSAFWTSPFTSPDNEEQPIHSASVAEGGSHPTPKVVQRHLRQLQHQLGSNFVREVFGNPFAPPHFDPAWRTETTTGIAAKLYDDKAFERMPILADALEEAGCDNADILSHCREPGVHVRGCWVVDLVLGEA